MSFLGDVTSLVGRGLASLAEPVIDAVEGLAAAPAKVAKELCDAILPASLTWLGDLASGAVNLVGGNYPGLVADALSIAKDIPSKKLASPGGVPSAKTTLTDPPPPPAHSDSAAATTTGTKASLTKATDPGDSAQHPGATTQPATSETATPKTPATSHAAATTSSSTSTSTASAAVNDFLKLTADDLMNAVRDGKIPQEVLDSQDGMLRLQTRMQQISEMTNLLSQLLEDMHQMNMAVIQNVRV